MTQPSRGALLIGIIVDAIQSNDKEELREDLQRLPLEDASDEVSNRLLLKLLTEASLWNRDVCARVIVERWQESNPEEERYPTLTSVFMLPGITVKTLRFVGRAFPELTYVGIMDDLINYDSSQETLTACNNLEAVFGEQPYECYSQLMDLINNQEQVEEATNEVIRDFLNTKMSETSPYAPIPSFVIKHPEDLFEDELMERLPSELPQLEGELPSTKVAIEMLTSGMKQLGLSFGDMENARLLLREKYENSTEREKRDLLRPVLVDDSRRRQENEIEVFKILGPSNPHVGLPLDGEDICAKYGGCRWMWCVEFERYSSEWGHLEEEDVTDWFVGYCVECKLRIKEKHHAIRRPLTHGGWQGCYCSFKCVRDNVTEINPILMPLISKIEEEVNKIGIWDRKVRENGSGESEEE